MENGNNGNGADDIFSGSRGNINQNDRFANGSAAPALTLERTVNQESEQTPQAEDFMKDATGGYSPESHRETLDKVRKQRKERIKLEQTAEEYWKDNDKNIATAMGIQPGYTRALVYNALGHVGVNMYKRDAQKVMVRLKSETSRLQSEVDKFQSRLEGKVQYIHPVQGTSDEEALKQKRYTRESDKGLRYRLSEATDEARMLGYQYRNGLRALEDYRQRIAQIDEDISVLKTSKDPTASAKVSNIQSEKSNLVREKEALELTQREYEQELVVYEKKMDRLQAKSAFYDCIIRKGNSKIRQVESAVDILDDYIRERDDLVSVHDLLNDLRRLDNQHARINGTIDQYDRIVGEQLDHLSNVVQNNDVEYSNRPLIQQVDQMSKEDQVATQKDMGRILGKLGIQA